VHINDGNSSASSSAAKALWWTTAAEDAKAQHLPLRNLWLTVEPTSGHVVEHFSDLGHYAKLRRSPYLTPSLPEVTQFVPILRTQQHTTRDRESIVRFEQQREATTTRIWNSRAMFICVGTIVLLCGLVTSYLGWKHKLTPSQAKVIAVGVAEHQQDWTIEESVVQRDVKFQNKGVGRVELDRRQREERGKEFNAHPEECYRQVIAERESEKKTFTNIEGGLVNRDEAAAERVLDRSRNRKRKHREAKYKTLDKMTLDDVDEVETVSKDDQHFQEMLLQEVKILLYDLGHAEDDLLRPPTDMPRGYVQHNVLKDELKSQDDANVIYSDGHAALYAAGEGGIEERTQTPPNQESISLLAGGSSSETSSADRRQSGWQKLQDAVRNSQFKEWGVEGDTIASNAVDSALSSALLVSLKGKLEKRLKQLRIEEHIQEGKVQAQEYWETAKHSHPVTSLVHNTQSSYHTALEDRRRYKKWLEQEENRARELVE
jgi:hypothetical protein